jgi:hypothetical protein
MLSLTHAKRSDRLMKAAASLTVAEFEALVAEVARLATLVGQLVPLHKPARKVRELRELVAREPALREVIIDGTERRVRAASGVTTAGAISGTPSKTCW